jgi:hypothetical protein
MVDNSCSVMGIILEQSPQPLMTFYCDVNDVEWVFYDVEYGLKFKCFQEWIQQQLTIRR